MIFGFSLYVISLQVALVIYFGRGLGELSGLGSLEGARYIVANTRR